MVEKLEKENGAQVEWKPFYLRPDTPEEGMELPAYVRSRMAGTQDRLKQMARANGLEMVFPNRIPNTHLAHEATEYARERGRQLEFHRAVFDKFYGKGEDISKWDVLGDAARSAGLDADEMQREVAAGKYTASVNALAQEAAQSGVSGVPTYVLNDRYAIVGAQPYEVFQQALARLAAESSESSGK